MIRLILGLRQLNKINQSTKKMISPEKWEHLISSKSNTNRGRHTRFPLQNWLIKLFLSKDPSQLGCVCFGGRERERVKADYHIIFI